MKTNNYYVYMIRCEDNSIYTGITTDIERRFNEHLKQNTLSANYTKSHKVKNIEQLYVCESRSFASKLEYRIKKLTKKEKESLICGDINLSQIIPDTFDRYIKITTNH